MSGRTLKRYAILIDGYDVEPFLAETPGKARWAAYVLFREAVGFPITFSEFLSRASTLHLGKARAGSGVEG